MSKISIIMPVFNDSEHIQESLNSVLNQTLTDIELICINDGSTDNSLDILKEYENKIKNMTIINQKNQGSGNARNKGIEIANGEYIAFLDADDIFVDKNALEIMYNMGIEYNANFISANLKGLTIDGKLVNNDNLKRFNKCESIKPEEYEIPYSFYKNIFKTTFIKKNNIYFPDLKRGQDPVFLSEILVKVNEIITVPVDLYGFRYAKNGGLSKINTYQKKYDYLKHFKDTFDILYKSKFNTMLNKYMDKLFDYLKFKNNKHDPEIYDAFQKIFEKNEYKLLTKTEKLFENIKISVIVPVYNAEQFLEESIGSVINQTLKEIEIICINDGSTDNSLSILYNLAIKDERIKIINKTNGGCGSARNKGLDLAKGEYVYFFDPDDILLPNAFEKLYSNAKHNNSEMVMFKIARFIDKKNINYTIPGFDFEKIWPNVDFENFTFNYTDIKKYVLNSSFAPWTKLYKKSFLDRYKNFRFETGVAFDDVPFHVASILRAKKISYVPDFFYLYRINPNSINNTSSNGIDIFKICDIVELFLRNEKYFDEFKIEFYNFKIKQILNYILSSKSHIYFRKAKNEFLKLNKKNLELHSEIKNNFYLVLNSNTFDEYKIKINKVDHYPENPDITVIIPIYNTSEYLVECLNSITKQTHKNIEILCIDDESEDNSLEIIESIADKDDRIKIFSKIHNGAGASRNLGLKYARGKYIHFMDSDDYIDLNTYENCLKLIEKYSLDIIMFQLINFNDKSVYEDNYYNLECISQFKGEIFNHSNIGEEFLDIPVSPCNKLIKKEKIEEINLRFDEGEMFEDNIFFFKLFFSCNKIYFEDTHYYKRRRHNSSIMSINKDNLIAAIPVSTKLLYFFKTLDIFEKYKTKIINFKIYFVRTYYNRIELKYKKDYYNELKNDFKKISKDKSIKNAINNNLYNDTKYFYETIINTNSFQEFDLILTNDTLKKNNEKLINENRLLKEQNYSMLNELKENKKNLVNITKINDKIISDNFILLNSNINLINKINQLKLLIKELNKKNNHLALNNSELTTKNTSIQKDYDNVKMSYNELLNSNSWKITKIFRKIRKI